MINFDALILSPAMDAFAWPIMVTPVASSPGAAAYTARGSFDVMSQRVLLEDGNELASVRINLGVRLNEFPALPRQGDKISITPPFGITVTHTYVIDAITPDSQGGGDIVLKRDSKS